jgi:hypothetical protein
MIGKKGDGGRPKSQSRESSPFGYRLVERKPRAGIVIAVVIALVAFVAYFYSLGVSNTH